MITAAGSIKTTLRKLWRSFTLADVPTVGVPKPQCDSCEDPAQVFISVRWMGGDPRKYQFCQRHKPHNYRV